MGLQVEFESADFFIFLFHLIFFGFLLVGCVDGLRHAA